MSAPGSPAAGGPKPPTTDERSASQTAYRALTLGFLLAAALQFSYVFAYDSAERRLLDRLLAISGFSVAVLLVFAVLCRTGFLERRWRLAALVVVAILLGGTVLGISLPVANRDYLGFLGLSLMIGAGVLMPWDGWWQAALGLLGVASLLATQRWCPHSQFPHLLYWTFILAFAGLAEFVVCKRVGDQRKLAEGWAGLADAQRRVAESEREFRVLFDFNPDPLSVNAVEDGKYLEINCGWLAGLGYTRAEVLGQRPLDLGIWANRDDLRAVDRVLRTQGEVTNYEAEFCGKDGSRFTCLVSAVVTRMGGADVVLACVRDVSKYKESERRLRDSENKFRQIFESSYDMIMLLDHATGAIEEVNAEFTRWTGFSREEAIGRRPVDLGLWKTATDYVRFLEILRTQGHVQNFEAEFIAKDGRPATRLLSSAQVGIGGRTLRLSVSRDITELKRGRQLLEVLLSGTEKSLDAGSESGLFREICEHLTATGLFVGAIIWRPDEAGRLRCACASPDGIAGVARETNPPVVDDNRPEQWPEARAWRTGETQRIDEFSMANAPEAWHRLAECEGAQCALATPIRRNGGLYAVLTVTCEQAHLAQSPLKALTVRSIEQLARLVGRMLEEIELKDELRSKHKSERWLARHDPLTRLPNRRAFEEFLPSALARADRHRRLLAICILDIDDFKLVNDRYGHAAGDHVLRVIGGRIQAALRRADFVGRLGGDEFALIAEDLESRDAIAPVCDRLVKTLSAQISLPRRDENLCMAVSIGIALYPGDSTDPQVLLDRADKALHRLKAAKADRPRCWVTFGETFPVQAASSPSPDLFYEDELRVHYQPIINLRTGAVVAVEALARLQRGDGLMLPGQFLENFNRAAREALFGAVLREGLALLNRLAPVAPALMLSVNIDAEGLFGDSAISTLRAALGDSHVRPQRIMLELLETQDLPDLHLVSRRIEEIRAYGVKLAIDDFGIQFATFQRARQLRAYSIKFDQSLVRHFATEPADMIVLCTLQTLCDGLHIKTCAEGVETLDTLEMLRILQVSSVQGFLIARPMPADALVLWLRNYKPLHGDEAPPQTLLGAMALLTRLVNLAMCAAKDASPLRYLAETGPMSLSPFIERHGLTKTPLGEAYEALRATLKAAEAKQGDVLRAAFHVRDELALCIQASARERRSEGGGC